MYPLIMKNTYFGNIRAIVLLLFFRKVCPVFFHYNDFATASRNYTLKWSSRFVIKKYHFILHRLPLILTYFIDSLSFSLMNL